MSAAQEEPRPIRAHSEKGRPQIAWKTTLGTNQTQTPEAVSAEALRVIAEVLIGIFGELTQLRKIEAEFLAHAKAEAERRDLRSRRPTW